MPKSTAPEMLNSAETEGVDPQAQSAETAKKVGMVEEQLPEPMDDNKLAEILKTFSSEATEYQIGFVTEERTRALAYYRGDGFGDEKEHRSQVVSRDVLEVVEGMLPSLERTFAGDSEAIVRFMPTSPEDGPVAKQVTEFVNRTVLDRNEGQKILQTWFKDALLQKNGIIKWGWEDTATVMTHHLENMTMEELVIKLESNPDYEPDESSVSNNEDGTFDITCITTEIRQRVRIDNVPPEEFLIDSFATSIEDASFISQRSYKTVSEVREMGLDLSQIDLTSLIGAGDSEDDNGDIRYEEVVRSGQTSDQQDAAVESLDSSTARVLLREEYVYVDYDGDGIAELRKVLRIGSEILLNEVVSEIPFASVCPYPMPHTFFGQSLADLVMDIQFYNTKLQRGILDGLELANTGRLIVMKGQVNPEDLLDARPNAIIRVKRPDAVQPLPTTPINPAAFQMIEVMERSKMMRTGVGPTSQGMSGGEIGNMGADSAAKFLDNADARIEQIARAFVPGLKRMYLGVYRTLRENWDPAKSEQLEINGEFGEVNPSEWPHREDVSVKVALGRNSNEQRAQQLMGLTKIVLDSGGRQMMTSQNVYNAAADIYRMSGFKNFADYISSPDQMQKDPQAKQAAEKQMQEQAEVRQLELAKLQAETAKMGVESQKIEAESKKVLATIEVEKMEVTLRQKEIESNIILETAKLELERQKAAQEAESGENLYAQ